MHEQNLKYVMKSPVECVARKCSEPFHPDLLDADYMKERGFRVGLWIAAQLVQGLLF